VHFIDGVQGISVDAIVDDFWSLVHAFAKTTVCHFFWAICGCLPIIAENVEVLEDIIRFPFECDKKGLIRNAILTFGDFVERAGKGEAELTVIRVVDATIEGRMESQDNPCEEVELLMQRMEEALADNQGAALQSNKKCLCVMQFMQQ
jgi:hypothetical protein